MIGGIRAAEPRDFEAAENKADQIFIDLSGPWTDLRHAQHRVTARSQPKRDHDPSRDEALLTPNTSPQHRVPVGDPLRDARRAIERSQNYAIYC